VETNNDEIIEEIRRHREEHAASLDYDLKRITRDLQEQERRSGRHVVTRKPKNPSSERGRSSV